MLMKVIEAQLDSLGIFAPRDKQAPTACIVGIGEKSQPMKVRNGCASFSQGAEPFVQIRGVVEGMATAFF